MNPKAKGELSEAMVMAALLRSGKVILKPFGDNQRYDLVIDEGTRFVRVQCKTARLREGYLLFSTASTTYHRGGGRQAYHGQADVFGVYSPDLDRVYMIPVSECPGTEAVLRVDAPRRNQKVVRMATDYEIHKWPSS